MTMTPKEIRDEMMKEYQLNSWVCPGCDRRFSQYASVKVINGKTFCLPCVQAAEMDGRHGKK